MRADKVAIRKSKSDSIELVRPPIQPINRTQDNCQTPPTQPFLSIPGNLACINSENIHNAAVTAQALMASGNTHVLSNESRINTNEEKMARRQQGLQPDERSNFISLVRENTRPASRLQIVSGPFQNIYVEDPPKLRLASDSTEIGHLEQDDTIGKSTQIPESPGGLLAPSQGATALRRIPETPVDESSPPTACNEAAPIFTEPLVLPGSETMRERFGHATPLLTETQERRILATPGLQIGDMPSTNVKISAALENVIATTKVRRDSGVQHGRLMGWKPTWSTTVSRRQKSAVGPCFGLQLCLPQPVLLASCSYDANYMALLLGSHADLLPSEVIIVSLDQEDEVQSTKIIASFAVQQSNTFRYLPLTKNSLQMAVNHKGEPLLVLSATLELIRDEDLSSGIAAMAVIPCAADPINRPIFIESRKDSALVTVVPHPYIDNALLVAGEGGSVEEVKFDPLWRSYTWGRTLPCAHFHQFELIDICRLSWIMETETLLGVSSDGLIAYWNLKSGTFLGACNNADYGVCGVSVIQSQIVSDSLGEHGPCFILGSLLKKQSPGDVIIAPVAIDCTNKEGALSIGAVIPIKSPLVVEVIGEYGMVGTVEGLIHFWCLKDKSKTTVLNIKDRITSLVALPMKTAVVTTAGGLCLSINVDKVVINKMESLV